MPDDRPQSTIFARLGRALVIGYVGGLTLVGALLLLNHITGWP